jgi:hypothetical protein
MAPSMCKTRMCELRLASASVGDFPCVQLRDTLTGRLPRARLPGHSVTPGGARTPSEPGASDSEPESPSPARYCPSRRLGGSVREWQLDRSSLTGLQVGTTGVRGYGVGTLWVLCGYCVVRRGAGLGRAGLDEPRLQVTPTAARGRLGTTPRCRGATVALLATAHDWRLSAARSAW